MKKIVPLLLFLIAAVVLQQKGTAQQTRIDTSYHLFFYKGEKVKENVLRTPQGDAVTYDPAKKTLKKVSKSGTGKELDNMLAELNKTPQRMNEMMQKLAGSLPRTVAPYYAKSLKEAYDEVKEEYSEALSNTIEIDEMPGFAKPSASVIADREKWMEAIIEKLKIEEMKLHEECRSYIRQHQNENIEVPTPPQKDYRYCSQCDKGIKERYKNEMKSFDEKLWGEEQRLISKILTIERTMQLLERDEVEGGIVDSTIKFILKRLGKKANLLLKEFGTEPLRIEPAVQAALSIERIRQLMSVGDTDKETLEMAEIAPIMKNLLHYLDKAVDEYDYTIALNPTLILSCYRQYFLFGGNDKDIQSLTTIEKALNLNSFKLKINVSGKLASGKFMQLAELKGDNYFSAMPDPKDTVTCRLKWVLTGPDPANEKVKYMQFDLTDVKLQGDGGEIVYVGTKKWKTPAPQLRIDFCNKGNDTALITSFQPDGKETWVLPKDGPRDLLFMGNILVTCFMDVDRLKKQANKEVMLLKMEQMKKEAAEFQKNYAAGQAPSQSQISSMMSKAKALSSGSMVSDMMQEFSIGSYLILPSPQNKNMRIFKERLDGKQLFPENTKIEHAWFDISLQQDPDSPYKIKM
jgi:hypothetical protein